VISKETTFIEGPLRADGRIDYLADLNRRLSEGVTPENNAAVPLFLNVGLDPIDESLRTAFYRGLGIDAPPLDGEFFVDSARFVRESAMGGPEAAAAFEERFMSQLASAGERGWSKAERPELASWLEQNRKPLAAVAAGLARPRYYMPLVGGDDDGYVMVAVLLPGVAKTRDVARALAARAMLRLHAGEVSGAQADLLACHRLARHVGTGPTLIEALVAIAIDNLACAGDAALARSGKLSAEQLQTHAAQLAKLPRITDVPGKIDLGERYMFLDSAMTMAVKGPGSLEELGEGGDSALMKAVEMMLGATLIDWNEPMRIGNSWYDKLVAAGRKKPYAEKAKALGTFDDELKAFAGEARDPAAMLRKIVFGGESPRKAIGRQVGNILIALLLPAVNKAIVAEDRQIARFDLTRLTLLLEAHRAEHGGYPEKLAVLAPKYLESLPRDPFSDRDFVYRRAEAGYQLYSVGPDQTDDGGAGDGRGAGEPDDIFLPS
jgi:hypothetical protein